MNSLIKDTFIYSSSKIFSSILNIVVIIIFTRLLTENVYGEYLIFISYAFFFSSLFYWWHRASVYRYLNHYKDDYQIFLKTIFVLFLNITLIIILINIVIIFLPINPNLKIFVYLASFSAFAKSLFDLNQTLLNIQFKSFLFSIHVLIKSLLFLIMSLAFFYFFNLGGFSLILSFLFSHLLIIIISTFIIFRNYFSFIYSKGIAQKILKFGYPLIGLFLFDYILTFSDRLFLDYYLGKSIVGIYGANYDLIKQLSLFFMMVQSYIFYPRINKAYSSEDKYIFEKIFNYNIIIFLILFLPLCFSLIYFNNFISTIFLGHSFTKFSSILIPFFSIMFFIWGIKIYHFDYIFQLKEKTTFLFYILLCGSLLNITLNIIMIPLFGIFGALYSTLIAYVIVLILSIIFTNQLIEIIIPYKVLFKVLLNLSICLIVLLYNPFPIIGSHIYADLINIFIFVVLYLFLTFLLNKKEIKLEI